jgi:hypothetical protein
MKSKNYRIPQTTFFTSVTAILVVVYITLCGSNTVQAQPVIANVYPNGTNMFQPTNTLSFTVTSSSGVTSLNVALTTTTLSGSLSYLQNLTVANGGLTVTGPNTAETVSASLKSNTLYSAAITATDANGPTTASYSFDTISPSYTWEAEDFDYNGGQYFDNGVDQYAGLSGVAGTDYNNTQVGSGNASYRPQGLETENPNSTGDKLRLQFINTTNFDYNVGWTATGEWGNYTHHYPAGLYNVYVRASDGNGNTADAAELSIVSGTASFVVAGSNTWSVLGEGWGTYQWCPVMDANGNLAQLNIPNDGGVSTIRSTIDQGNCNLNFFMLVPADTNVIPVTASFTNVYPDGKFQFEATNWLSFTVNSTNGIDTNNITVQLGVTNLLGQGFVTNFPAGDGLVVSGTSDSWNCSVPLLSNMVYTAFLQVIDKAGNPASMNLTFDTVSPLYSWEAEDYDYTDGGYIEGQTNAYLQLSAAQGVDIQVAAGNQYAHAYRGTPNISGPGDFLNNEPNGDVPRVGYGDTNNLNPITEVPFADYDIGWNSGGDWGNYTRHYPAGSYNIYMRGANGGENGASSQGAGYAELSLLTSGYGVGNETVTNLGEFTIYGTGNWQKYNWWPLKDTYGNLAKITFDGSQQTLRVTTIGQASGGSYNANYYMLVPAITNLPGISEVYPDGTALFQYTNKLSFVATSGAGIATSNIVVMLNGVKASGLTFTSVSSGWSVSCPLQANSAYNLTITVTDNSSQTVSSTISFDTFQSTDYQFEAEDYDYTSNGVSGLFVDNPQTNAYFGLLATPGIDLLESDQNANGFAYRTNTSLGLQIPTSASADLPRAQFANTTDYSIGFFGPGSWCNFTRHYPAGTYNVWERYAEGGSATASTLSKVTAGYGTASQTTSLLGTFTNLLGGWSSWTWSPLKDANGNMVQVTLDGSQTTLQLGGSPDSTKSEVNVNFLLLAPVTSSGGTVTLTASISGGNINISFPTQNGHTYQLLSNSTLTGGTWSSVGSPVTGDGSTKMVSDTVGSGNRFYRLQIQ